METDFKREIATCSADPGVFSIVRVPLLTYVAIDGCSDPNTSPAYDEALFALYPVAYGVKFLSKTELDRDYVVVPLEAL